MSQQKGETEPELSITSAEGAATEPELGITPAETATTEPEQNTTKPKAKGGRPRKAPDTGLWAIRGVDLETRAIVEKTAQRAGKTIGQFVNEDMRSFCQGQLTQSGQPASGLYDLRACLFGERSVSGCDQGLSEFGGFCRQCGGAD